MATTDTEQQRRLELERRRRQMEAQKAASIMRTQGASPEKIANQQAMRDTRLAAQDLSRAGALTAAARRADERAKDPLAAASRRAESRETLFAQAPAARAGYAMQKAPRAPTLADVREATDAKNLGVSVDEFRRLKSMRARPDHVLPSGERMPSSDTNIFQHEQIRDRMVETDPTMQRLEMERRALQENPGEYSRLVAAGVDSATAAQTALGAGARASVAAPAGANGQNDRMNFDRFGRPTAEVLYHAGDPNVRRITDQEMSGQTWTDPNAQRDRFAQGAADAGALADEATQNRRRQEALRRMVEEAGPRRAEAETRILETEAQSFSDDAAGVPPAGGPFDGGNVEAMVKDLSDGLVTTILGHVSPLALAGRAARIPRMRQQIDFIERMTEPLRTQAARQVVANLTMQGALDSRDPMFAAMIARIRQMAGE